MSEYKLNKPHVKKSSEGKTRETNLGKLSPMAARADGAM